MKQGMRIKSKYSLIHTRTESNRGHGLRKMVLPDFGHEKILLEAAV